MNKEMLKLKLVEEGIREDAYSLAGDESESYCLDNSYDDWSVYYFERGIRTGEKNFESESDACSYLLEVLLRVFTTKP